MKGALRRGSHGLFSTARLPWLNPSSRQLILGRNQVCSQQYHTIRQHTLSSTQTQMFMCQRYTAQHARGSARSKLRQIPQKRNSTHHRELLENTGEINLETVKGHLKKVVEDPATLETFSNDLSRTQQKVLSKLVETTSKQVVPEPSLSDLRLVAIATAIPFIGFGIMDNGIMILAGDAIDQSLGVALGISTMCAAAIGNIISDVAGVMLGAVVEDFCSTYLALPVPALTAAQRQLRSVRFANQFGCAVGLVIGCTIGMIPLLFLDSTQVNVMKRKAALDNLFQDVVTEAGDLVGAQRMRLYIVCNKPKTEVEGKSTWIRWSRWLGKRKPDEYIMPASDGAYLYAKYFQAGAGTDIAMGERWINLGRGIVSRAALTGEVWNIDNVTQEPDYMALDKTPDFEPRNMLSVPVLDGNGNAIAVLQAINKVGKNSPSFTEHDVQTLQALASHVSVSLQRMYFEASKEGAEEEAHSLKNTIQILQGSGITSPGTFNTGAAEGFAHKISNQKLPRQPLFPED